MAFAGTLSAMGFSSALLLVAVLCALVPVIAIGPKPPTTLRHLERGFVSGAVALAVSGFALTRWYSVGLFGLIHLAYLLVVVTLPLLLGTWSVLAVVRRRRSTLTRVYGIGALALALAGGWGTHIEPNWLDVDQVQLIADVDRSIRVGVLADVQTPNVGEHENRAIDLLIEAAPDLVVVPGDLFQGDRATIAANAGDFTAMLRRLVDAGPTVAVVSGDSDEVSLLVQIVDDAGALFIDNRIRDVRIGDQTVRLAGVQVAQTAAQLTTIADLSAPSEAMTILVAHRPDVVYQLPSSSEVDLIVSGHTHGGQVSLPFFGPPVTFSDVPRSLAAGGLGIVDNFAVYVSTGVGLERLDAPQVRFGVRPTVGVIDIVPDHGNADS